MNWLMLFDTHREAVQRALTAEHTIANLEDTIELLSKTIGELKDRQVAPAPADVPSLLESFRDNFLVEEPWPDNKVPDNAWLTPSYETKG